MNALTNAPRNTPNEPSFAASKALRAVSIVLGVALLLGFVALALTRESTSWAAQTLYLVSAALLLLAITWTRPVITGASRWAAMSALGGLVATEIFAATELEVVHATEWQGVGALIVPAWLFAATSWLAHQRDVRSLRWVVTLVQVSFTSLSAALFVVLAARADAAVGVLGYGAAALVGAIAGVVAIIGIVQRVQREVRRRSRLT